MVLGNDLHANNFLGAFPAVSARLFLRTRRLQEFKKIAFGGQNEGGVIGHGFCVRVHGLKECV
jgi:hypothetical protein